jgi:dipeptidyl aminopeptidase/acylaminoacyl peptidase
MEKKILIGLCAVVALFLVIVGPAGFMKAYKYYYGVPFMKPEGTIIFKSNRLTESGSSAHVLVDGELKNTKNGLMPRFVKGSGRVVSWGGIDDNVLYISDENMENPKPLEFTRNMKIHSFDVSPDGKRIAFVSDTKLNKPNPNEKAQNLFVADLDGSNLKQLTNLDRELFFSTDNPRWSPDGKKIIFEYVDNSNLEVDPGESIFLIDSDGLNLKKIISVGKYKGLRINPCWSPDGKNIAYASYEQDKNGSYNIYVMSLDGRSIERITTSPLSKKNPVFSPDGTKICYVGHPTDPAFGELFIVDLKTRKEYRVLKPVIKKSWPYQSNDDEPDWRR